MKKRKSKKGKKANAITLKKSLGKNDLAATKVFFVSPDPEE